jgi:UDP-N-acetylmuramoylalanine--D-glutamate ligase
MNNFKSVLVIGCGITGLSVCRFLAKKGIKIYLNDDNIINLQKYPEYISVVDLTTFDIKLVDFVVISPSVQTVYNPHLIVKMARQNGIEIWTDLDILQYFYKAKYIGVTGTNGKSTTVSMLYHVMQANGLSVYLGGNIGIPMLDIDKNYDYIILELSSYQLENARNLYFDFSAILNITPSHLDHHGNFENYKNAKLRLTSQSHIVGSEQNVSTVIELALKIGLNTQQINDALKTYKPLAHRAENIATIGRISFINDSKATNIPAVVKAISENENIVIIMGGRMLTNYDELPKFFALKNKIKKAFLIGESAEFLSQKLTENGIQYEICGNLEKAVKQSYKHAITLTKNNKWSNFIVMLCPMHPSQDQFFSFEERGNEFKKFVSFLI